MKIKKLARIVIGLVVIFLIAYCGLSYYIMDRVTAVEAECARHPGENNYTPDNYLRENFDTTPYLMDTWEDVSFPSRDSDVTVSAWFIPNQNSQAGEVYPTVIITHGFSDCKKRPFSLIPSAMLTRHGYNTLVIDLQNHGDSTVISGRAAGGITEYKDILGAYDWLVSEKGIPSDKVGLFGYSMGAATSIIAASEIPEIRAVWADSSYSQYPNAVSYQLDQRNIGLLMPGVNAGHRLITGIDWSSRTPEDALKHYSENQGLFIVHGDADTTVPVEEAQILADAYPGDVAPWIIPGTKHIEAMYDETAGYEERLLTFFDAYLKP